MKKIESGVQISYFTEEIRIKNQNHGSLTQQLKYANKQK